MRIIGQNRDIDINYDDCMLQIEDYTTFSQISAVINGKWYALGIYDDKKTAKAVLWHLAYSYKKKEIYYEMPKRHADWLTYPRNEEENDLT